MQIKYAMACLSFELTRRCNLKCEFCGRGKSQKLDITKEVIDKTLDEMQSVFLNQIRLNGGEPFINPDMVVYLIDEIIKRHIYVNLLFAFTNGTIKDNRIKDALKRFLKYRHSINDEIKTLILKFDVSQNLSYKHIKPHGLAVIVSSYFHPTSERTIQDTIDFYNDINDEYYTVISQSKSLECVGETGQLIIGGNMVENYRNVLPEVVQIKNIRIIDNHYFFIRDYYKENRNLKYISKTLSVSANGNVYTGCLQSYENIDKAPIFNIMNCQNDFMDRIIDWCWKHPVNMKVNSIREIHNAVQWCIERGMKIDANTETIQLLKKHYDLTFASEKIAKEMHEEYPDGNFSSIDMLANSILCFNMFNMGENVITVAKHLELCTFMDRIVTSQKLNSVAMKNLAFTIIGHLCSQKNREGNQ